MQNEEYNNAIRKITENYLSKFYKQQLNDIQTELILECCTQGYISKFD